MEWRPAKDYFGHYEVSDTGLMRNAKTGYLKKQRLNKGGYPVVSLLKNGIKKDPLVHRVVAKTFIQNPENKPFLNHIDGNKQNNSVSNLEWCTKSENEKHAYAMGLKFSNDYHKQRTIEANIRRRTIPIDTIYYIRESPKTQQSLADELGLSRQMVGFIRQGKRYGDIGAKP